MSVSVIEIRNYRLKPGMREAIIDYFQEHFVDSQEALGMTVIGAFRIIGEPNRFLWFRGFNDVETRAQRLDSFYGGAVWEKYGPGVNEMMLEWHNVHYLRPITPIDDLNRGVTAEMMAAQMEAGTISPYTGVIAVDIYQAKPGQREALINALQSQIVPRYQSEGVQVRGLFVAEMSENAYPRLPVIQNPDEVVVVTAYADENVCRGKRQAIKPAADQAIGGLLNGATESLLLVPTLRSPLRYLQAETT